jgi:hypothetical protein
MTALGAVVRGRREQMARPSTGSLFKPPRLMVPAQEPSLQRLLHHGFMGTALTSRPVALIRRPLRYSRRFASREFRVNQVLEPADECPHCRLPLEILSVKVGLRGTAMVCACTNCAMMRTERPKQPLPRRLLGALRVIRAKFGQHSSSEAFRELAVGVDAREIAHDTHDRSEGPTGTIGTVAQAEDADIITWRRQLR